MRYCFTDLHGQYGLWEQIKNYATQDDELYFLGDACDRGPDGVKIIQELLADPRIHYLKGNHEQFVVDTIAWLLNMNQPSLSRSIDYAVNLHYANGGYQTIEDLKQLSNLELYDLMIKLDHLPTSIELTNSKGQKLFLSHAGKDPSGDVFANATKYGEPLLWNRNHFHYAWPKGEQYENLWVLHGHTPVAALSYFHTLNDDEMDIPDPDHEEEVFYYANGHKIDLDLGSFQSNKIALLNLDDLQEVKYFTEVKNEGEDSGTIAEPFRLPLYGWSV